MRTLKHYKTKLELPEFEAHLVQQGYKQVGQGCWSTVWGKPGDSVVCKVGGAGQKGYLTFVQEVLKRPTNPHLPKIYKGGVFHKGNQGYFVLYMERLTPSKSVGSDFEDAWYTRHGLADWKDFGDESLVERLKIEGDTKELRELAKVLDRVYKKHNEDMAPTNVMWRTQGKEPELVIIDPVWG